MSANLHALNLTYDQGIQKALVRELLTCGAIKRTEPTEPGDHPSFVNFSDLTINLELIPDGVLKKMAGALVGKIRSTPAPCSPPLMVEAFTGLDRDYELAKKVREAYPQRAGLRVPGLLRLVQEGSEIIIHDGIMSQTLKRGSFVTLFSANFTMQTMTTVSSILKLGYRVASLAFIVGPTADADLSKACGHRCNSLFREDQFPVTAI